MTLKHANYLYTGITRVLSQCHCWNDPTMEDKTWDERYAIVKEDLNSGRLVSYINPLKNALRVNKSKISDCYINNTYVVSVINILKIFKQDFKNGKLKITEESGPNNNVNNDTELLLED